MPELTRPTSAPHMPGRHWYAVALFIWIIGAAASVFFLFNGLTELDARLIRLVVPGSLVFDVSEPGSYTIFHETRSVVDGRLYDVKDVRGLQVVVNAEKSGQVMPLTGASHSTYEFGGYSGEAILAFEASEVGKYKISGFYPNTGGPETVLTVSSGFAGYLIRTIFTTIAVGLTGFLIALAIVIITFVKRRRAKRMLVLQATSSG